MQGTTVEAVKAIVRADPSISPQERQAIVVAVQNCGKKVEVAPVASSRVQVLRRGEVAERLAKSVRTVDALARAGFLRKVTLPGRIRGAGFLLADVERLMIGGALT